MVEERDSKSVVLNDTAAVSEALVNPTASNKTLLASLSLASPLRGKSVTFDMQDSYSAAAQKSLLKGSEVL